jgi:hypothetical protein
MIIRLSCDNWLRGQPFWMKDSGSMNGGSLRSQYIHSCAFLCVLAIISCWISPKFRWKLFIESRSGLSQSRIFRSCDLDPGSSARWLFFLVSNWPLSEWATE